jgi:hypothetical protein
MLPRRTVDTLAPDDLARPFPNRQGSLSGTVFSKKTLAGSSLGDVNAYGGAARSPFKLFGAQAAAWIEKHILQNKSLTPDQRKEALRKVLDKINPGLRLAIGKKAEAFRQQGDLPIVAFRKAMAEALAEGLMDEVQGLGRKGLSGTSRLFSRRLRGSSALGQTPSSALHHYSGVALGDYSGPRSTTLEVAGYKWPVTIETNGVIKGTKTFTSPGGFQGLHLPSQIDKEFRRLGNELGLIYRISLVRGGFPVIRFRRPNASRDHGIYVKLDQDVINDKIKKAIVTIKEIPPPNKSLLDKAVGGITKIYSLPAKVLGEVATGAIDVVKDVVEKIGDLACSVVSSDAGTAAAGVAGGVYGGPVGAQAGVAGAQAGAQICGKGGGPPPPPPPEPFPILPVALAGVGVVLVYLAVKE